MSYRFVAPLLLGWLLALPVHAAPSTEVIALGYNLAENIVPIIEPMLEPDERVSAYGNQLIIRAEPERIDEIRALIVEIDREPSRLRISVANSEDFDASQRGFGVDGRIDTGPVDIEVGDASRGNQTRIIRRQTRGSSDGVRQITANEGYPVMIQRGNSVPITTTTTNAYGQVVQQTQYRDVAQGFYATVRLSGDMATIYLSANNDQINRNDKRVIDVQRADTVVTARLGEWVTLGGIGDAEADEASDIGRRISTQRSDQGTLRLKVERIN